MARQAQPVRQPVVEYHVYNDTLKTLAGMEVIDKDDGARVVRMNPTQAQYLVDQGIIGVQPFEDLSVEHQNLLRQFRRKPSAA